MAGLVRAAAGVGLAGRAPVTAAGYLPAPAPSSTAPPPCGYPARYPHPPSPAIPSPPSQARWVHDTQHHSRLRSAAATAAAATAGSVKGAPGATLSRGRARRARPAAAGTDRLADFAARGHPRPARLRSGAQHRGDRHRAAHRSGPGHAPLRRARPAPSPRGGGACQPRDRPADRAGHHERGRGWLRPGRGGRPGRRRAARARRQGRDRDDGTAPRGKRPLLVVRLRRSRVLPAGGHAVRHRRPPGRARPAGRRRPRARRPRCSRSSPACSASIQGTASW